MKGLYYPVRSTDNAPPHSGHYTLQYTAATKSWKDLLRGICSQYFHCQQVHLWKVNECVFFTSPNFSPNWGLSWKDTKSCSKPYSTKIVWKEWFLLLPFSIETWSFNLLQGIFPVLGSKGASPHLENPPWCAISFKLRTVRRSSCLGSNFQLDWCPIWLNVTRSPTETSDWC